jgi:hypothetical protein
MPDLFDGVTTDLLQGSATDLADTCCCPCVDCVDCDASPVSACSSPCKAPNSLVVVLSGFNANICTTCNACGCGVSWKMVAVNIDGTYCLPQSPANPCLWSFVLSAILETLPQVIPFHWQCYKDPGGSTNCTVNPGDKVCGLQLLAFRTAGGWQLNVSATGDPDGGLSGIKCLGCSLVLGCEVKPAQTVTFLSGAVDCATATGAINAVAQPACGTCNPDLSSPAFNTAPGLLTATITPCCP